MISVSFLSILALTLGFYLYEEPAWPMPLESYARFLVRKFLECFLGVAFSAGLAWALSRLDFSSAAFIRFLAFAGFLGVGYLRQRRESLYAIFLAAGLTIAAASPDLIASLSRAAEVSAIFIIFRVALDSIRARLLLVPVPAIFSGTPAFLISFWLTAVILFAAFGFLMNGR